MNSFEIAQSPVSGVHLIEAGAGTGKTYTIAGLFLRLIAERAISIEQILVVTYTKAATEELKSRIRRRLVSAKAYLTQEGLEDTLMQTLLQSGVERGQALRRIQDALIDFDRASIFTIHGFCQRVLHHFAFETGHLFEAKLIQDMQPLIQEVCDDFWRRYINRAPAEVVRFVIRRTKGPEALIALCHTCRFPGVRIVPPAGKPPLRAIAQWRRIAAQLLAMWPQARSAVHDLLLSEGLHALKYGNCEPHPDQPEMTRRQTAVAGLIAAMDQWDGSYPLFERFERFCQSCIAQATKKKFAVPTHPFFAICDQVVAWRDEMDAQLADYWRYLKVRLLDELQRRLNQKKARENVLFFDDLLLQVHTALQDNRQAGLVSAIQKQYQAALVDEFQDTDALQYEIFTALFSKNPSLLFMIGDPKQAIYSFRGADIFSYLQAKENASNRYTLTRNYRATPALTQAFNTLFGSRARPFGYEQIPYAHASAARSACPSDTAPFHLWYVTRTDQQGPVRPLSQQEAVPRIVAAVADRIVALLSDALDPIEPEQIAVLTRTHHQAQLIKAALAGLLVPAVLHSAGSVFDSSEAAELELVLRAVALPADLRRVRAALAGDLFGIPARELCASIETSGDEWQGRWNLFEQYHQMWIRQGFYSMFSRLMAQEGVRSRLLGSPDGERRLTNLLHLAELLHEASVMLQLGPEGLLKWLTTQRSNSATAADDEQKLRLESDAHAVRIITIHKSKGLQFEVVFCPFVWAPAKVNDEIVSFHDPRCRDQLTLAIGPGIDAQHQQLALEEALAENLRLMYVALTRARRRCYMAWGAIKGTSLSAPAYLLHGPRLDSGEKGWVEPLRLKMAALSDADMIAELKSLAQASDGAIQVEALPQPILQRYKNPYQGNLDLTCREFSRTIDTSWRIASFSSMIANLPESERPDRDAFVQHAAEAGAKNGPDDLYSFPKGVRAGLFFHDLLEHWDPAGTDAAQRKQLVFTKLESHGFPNEETSVIDRFLERLARVRLPTGDAGSTFSLNETALDKRVNEMEFYFPIRKSVPGQFRKIFKEWGGPIWSELSADPLERLSFAPVQGFLKGYVDMVFEHGGRFYLVDWKSNYLGNSWADYDPARLDKIMAESFYFLQSHLYALALDLLLRQRVKSYEYKSHFGGVYYLFLRGIQGGDAATGIHFTVPEAGLMKALCKLLGLPVGPLARIRRPGV